jgi:hypothetical protein
VTRQFFSHFESKNGAFHCMMKNVEANQAGVEIAVRKGVPYIVFRYRHSIAIASIAEARDCRQSRVFFRGRWLLGRPVCRRVDDRVLRRNPEQRRVGLGPVDVLQAYRTVTHD